MAISFNKVIIAGNMTGDAQVKELGEKNLALFSVAVNDSYKSDAPPTYFDCEYWNPNKVLDYMVKGTPILVEGRLKTHHFEKDGEKRQKMRLVVGNVQLLGGGKKKTESLEDDFAGRF